MRCFLSPSSFTSILHKEGEWELCHLCRTVYTDHGISSRSLGLHRVLLDFSAALSMIQSLFCNFCALGLRPHWVSALSTSSFATQCGEVGAPGLQRQGVWECSATWLSNEDRFVSHQVKGELRSMYISLNFADTLSSSSPSRVCNSFFCSKAKVISVPPAFPAELKRKAGLLQTKCGFGGNTFAKKLLI